jgi:cob(I)alamin adenosyltransferase
VSPRERDEPVRLTKIYTRGGDAGETSLGDMSRVSKLDPLVRAYGAVDELNSVLGWVLVEVPTPTLVRIQNELFDVGADLSVPYDEGDGKLRIDQAAIDRLEADCDEANAPLVLEAAQTRPVNPLSVVYLNRLSDLLFILARAANDGDEPLWLPGGQR